MTGPSDIFRPSWAVMGPGCHGGPIPPDRAPEHVPVHAALVDQAAPIPPPDTQPAAPESWIIRLKRGLR